MKAKKDSKFGLSYDFPTSPGDINMNQNSGFSGNKGYFMDNTLADPSYTGKKIFDTLILCYFWVSYLNAEKLSRLVLAQIVT